MSKLVIEIEMDGAAFEDDATSETQKCLRRVVRDIGQALSWNRHERLILDSNGNAVGFWRYEP
jgi:hypothetical protein